MEEEPPPSTAYATHPSNTPSHTQHQRPVVESAISTDQSSLFGLDSPKSTPRATLTDRPSLRPTGAGVSSNAPTPTIGHHHRAPKAMERKYTVLSEFAASKQPHFRLEKFDSSLPLIVELETSSRMQKCLRAFEKKHPGVLETVLYRVESPSALVGNGDASAQTNGVRPVAVEGIVIGKPVTVDKSTAAALVKFVKEVCSSRPVK